MTKLQIISRLWSTIYDLKLKQKSEAEIDQDLDILEYECRKYADVDDEEIEMDNEVITRAEHALKVILTVRCPELSSAHQTIALCLMQ